MTTTARKAFEQYADQYDNYGDEWQDMGVDEHFIAGYYAGFEAGRAQGPADKPEGEWVKCSKRLPEITGWFCVALTDPDDIGWSTSVSWVAFWNGDDFEECDPIEDGQPVTHWMPLPKPPAAPDMGGEK